MSDILDHLLSANAHYAEGFDRSKLSMPPSKHLAILTCMDARIMPQEIFGLGTGDAHVIRNAGGRATDDAVRSLIISNELLGTREFLVVHHTDCGMVTFTDGKLQERLKKKTGKDASSMAFHTFKDQEQSVRDDVKTIRSNPFISKDIPVHGFVYDVKTGRLSPV